MIEKVMVDSRKKLENRDDREKDNSDNKWRDDREVIKIIEKEMRGEDMIQKDDRELIEGERKRW